MLRLISPGGRHGLCLGSSAVCALPRPQGLAWARLRGFPRPNTHAGYPSHGRVSGQRGRTFLYIEERCELDLRSGSGDILWRMPSWVQIPPLAPIFPVSLRFPVRLHHFPCRDRLMTTNWWHSMIKPGGFETILASWIDRRATCSAGEDVDAKLSYLRVEAVSCSDLPALVQARVGFHTQEIPLR